jgi:hypothetical protein
MSKENKIIIHFKIVSIFLLHGNMILQRWECDWHTTWINFDDVLWVKASYGLVGRTSIPPKCFLLPTSSHEALTQKSIIRIITTENTMSHIHG